MSKLWNLTVGIIMLLTPLVWAGVLGWLFKELGWSRTLGAVIGMLVVGAAIVTVGNQSVRRPPVYP